MSVNKSIKRIVRQFCAERNWIHDSQDKRQQIRRRRPDWSAAKRSN